jgi:hypothetical protein
MAGPDVHSFLRETAALKLWELWERGQRPDLAQFLSRASRLSSSELVAVLRTDQLKRWSSGEPVLVESYLSRYPAAGELTLDLVYGECLAREGLGETLSLAEYQHRFPQFSQSLLVLGAPRGNPPASEPERTPTIPGFEILGLIGRGATGAVYKARQLDPDRNSTNRRPPCGDLLATFGLRNGSRTRTLPPSMARASPAAGSCS